MTDKIRNLSFLEFLESSLFILYKTPQIDFLAKTNCLEDIKIIRFENLKEELFRLKLFKEFGKQKEFPHLNKSERNKNWKPYINEKSEEIIWNDYQEDFKEFGYERYQGE